MSEKGSEQPQPRRKKKHDHPAHGGAWKVAFADFMTSMFALFLVLWIISSTSASQKEAVAQYFRNPTLFRAGSPSPLDMGGNTRTTGKNGEEDGKSTHQLEKDAEQREKDKLKELDSLLAKDSLLAQLGKQFKTRQTEQGLEIEISDAEGLGTFHLGSAEINQRMEAPLAKLAGTLSGIPNHVVVAGHTDKYGYSGAGYSNWQLSTDRANAVRGRLNQGGVELDRVNAVVGYGDTELANPGDPYAPENRRVTILVLKQGRKFKP
ncbi:MAG TPA: flagellar motor protein MotB [Fibrobacteria bacterium]|nr:flagellar motor protein MotB [Fibrobacteria bacterium]HOX50437.1 flagellar motor protein MotB [Fibrobacteria bacterium]